MFLAVRFVLSQYFNATLQSSAIFSYLFLYLFPVGYVVFTKLGMSSSVRRIEEGTFCFKPSMSVRANQVVIVIHLDIDNTNIITLVIPYYTNRCLGQCLRHLRLRSGVDSACSLCFPSRDNQRWKRCQVIRLSPWITLRVLLLVRDRKRRLCALQKRTYYT